MRLLRVGLALTALPAFAGEGGLTLELTSECSLRARQSLAGQVRSYFQKPSKSESGLVVSPPLEFKETTTPKGEWVFSRSINQRHLLLPFSLKEADAKRIALDFLYFLGMDESDAVIENVLLHQVKDERGTTSIEDAILTLRQSIHGMKVFGLGSTMVIMVGKEGWIHRVVLDWLPLASIPDASKWIGHQASSPPKAELWLVSDSSRTSIVLKRSPSP